MMFYNGFNLMIDLILIAGTALWFHGVGYRKGVSMRDRLKPKK